MSYNVIPKTLGERITFCLKASQLKKKDLTKYLNVSPEKVNRFIRNEEIPDQDQKCAIADYLAGGNYDWIIHGVNITNRIPDKDNDPDTIDDISSLPF